MKRLCFILYLPVLSALGGSWTADEAMLLYFDAATTIRHQALAPRELPEIVTGSLTGYLDTLDPHSRFFPADEFAQWTRSQASDYAGVGMELAQDRDGRFVCLPYPGSPAGEAGIRDGDRLLAVDGVVHDRTDLVSVGMRVRGPPDSTVSLRMQSGDEPAREVQVVRKPIRAPSVVTEVRDEMKWIRIYRFAETTTAELASAMAKIPDSEPVLIDLRGNPGGSLYDAIDAAGLFLSNGAVIAEVRTRESTRVHRNEKRTRFPDHRLWVLQDERTASSAEVFTAALIGHDRARSIGVRTAGKGTTQSMIRLVDGAALLLTVGELHRPDGTGYDGMGLEPSEPLALDQAGLEGRVRRVMRTPP